MPGRITSESALDGDYAVSLKDQTFPPSTVKII